MQLCECLQSIEQIISETSTKRVRDKKTKKPTGQLAETTNVVQDAMAVVDRQKKNITLSMEKETTLPMDVG